jgi:hypothetical protein
VSDTLHEQQQHLRAEAVLSSRLEHVEREYRRLRRFNMILFVGAAVLLGLIVALVAVSSRYGVPGTVADIIAARQFVLRGPDGAVRGVWGTDKDGAVRLVLQDSQGRPRTKLNLLGDGASGLTFSDSAGHPRAVFAFLPNQSSSIVLADENGKTRVVLGVNEEVAPRCVRRPGHPRRPGRGPNGSGSFTLTDRWGARRRARAAALSTTARQSARPRQARAETLESALRMRVGRIAFALAAVAGGRRLRASSANGGALTATRPDPLLRRSDVDGARLYRDIVEINPPPSSG